MKLPSKSLENAVREISGLPGIGQKTALRLCLHLLKSEKKVAEALAEAILQLRTRTLYCKKCHNISDAELCGICVDPRRDHSVICVTEDIRDVLAIENTEYYRGVYHVLGGIISPVEGIGPGDLHIDDLITRAKEDDVKEIIFALSSTMEGDTTTFYITKKLKDFTGKISMLARGIPIGGELEYADEITLGRSILSRTNYLPEAGKNL